ncbi:MAG: ACP phosphodiesterase [Flavobacterium sp.]
MNFLAHIFLSQNIDKVKIGNFIADSVRGNNFGDFDPEVQKGIILHRSIDTFTDAHPIFRIGTKRLHSRYHHYAGVILDVFYDHFLARNWSRYSSIPLQEHNHQFYDLLEKNLDWMPERIEKILPIMRSQDWLTTYATIGGLSEILFQMDRRTKLVSKMQFAPEELEEFYDEYEAEFFEFFEELRKFVDQKWIEINAE